MCPTRIRAFNMGLFDYFKREKNENVSVPESPKISSFRYHGRWYGLMLCLGQESGHDIEKEMKDKASEVLMMLKISNDFPEDFKYVSKLMSLEDEQQEKEKGKEYSDNERQRDFLLGIVEAKKVYLEGKKWEKLLVNDKV